uniref:G_PROTEIN_RECEP_F1_2 domain-containing protein n=1 Tax=Gongylonema pulchrum TaxID=637853 RepID=A0A183EIC1_9BILA
LQNSFQIKQNVDCSGTLAEYTLELSATALNPTYNVLWRFWFRNIITILLPFFLLAFLNAQIVIVLQRNQHAAAPVDQQSIIQFKGRVRAATRTLVFVVFTYLLSNVLNVIITIWEYIDIETLMTDYIGLYIFCADLVSLLTTLAGSLRLSIYAMCQPQLRREFKQAACRVIRSPLKFKVVLQSLCKPTDAAVDTHFAAAASVLGTAKTIIIAQCNMQWDSSDYEEIFL